MKKVIKIIVSILLTFVIMTMFLSSSIFSILKNYAEKDYLIAKLEETDIYRQIYDGVQSGFEEYIYQSGLEVSVFKNICDEEKIKKDFLGIIDSMYNGTEYKIDTDIIKENLDKEIKEYIKNENRKLTTEEEKNIEEFENLIVNSYNDSISSYMNLSKVVKGNLNGVSDKCSKIEIISIAILIVSIVILTLINKKHIFYGIGYVGSAILAAGAVLLIAKNIVINNVKIDNLILFTKALSNSVIYIIKEILNSINTFGIWYIGIGIFIIVMTAILSLDTSKEDNKSKH